jgi:hypothetical protein
MKAIHKVMMVSAVAISAFAFVTFAGSPAQAGPNVPPGHNCMVWTLGGSDCSFTSYAECLATASGVAVECYGKTVHHDEGLRIQDRCGYDSRAQIH